MFEKSLYDLIRGLRNHKGNEKEYIQNCLKECRSEIRSSDMDVKATAVLKLIYLEMLGYDMSWASFQVLEVMSSNKYHQKRVGYLGAVQSFRLDTEMILMSTNLLKKDLSASMPTTIALPIAALPHIITPSLAMSVLADLLPRLSHSLPAIRKKTVVTLYRLALVYPETLRAAWPKIKERLMDKDEDSAVTAAIVNVICELGWRRPNDFLPLAPRLFELLVEGGNNWMAIKLIKLFATLTPLEPRLVRKLLPPLTDIIRTTPAMSLLYECINGIIQGGILGDSDDVSGREEIASLCVTKLRSMIMMRSDANLVYVALLAFNRIVLTHPFLVAEQEDVILECIDSEDITIRIKALDLVQGMVSADNLLSIVSRLMRQLKASSVATSSSTDQRNPSPTHDENPSDEEERPASRSRPRSSQQTAPPLPEDYTVDVISRILSMCSQNNYAHLVDFEWYIDVLLQLVRAAPTPRPSHTLSSSSGTKPPPDISEKIGNELRSVAVKVRAVRSSAVAAADSILAQLSSLTTPSVSLGVIKPAAFVVGEYSELLNGPEDVLGRLLHLVPRTGNPEALGTVVQAVIKLLARIAGDEDAGWTLERKSKISLLLARTIHALEPLAGHPYLEVQERAVQFEELLKLTAEAVAGQADGETPLLLSQAMPSLFKGWELNSVAMGAQGNVPLPEGLGLDEPIHGNLSGLLAGADGMEAVPAGEEDEFEMYYNQRPAPSAMGSDEPAAAISRLVESAEETPAAGGGSYQAGGGEESYLDADIVARRKAERRERERDDPFYIPSAAETGTGRATPIHSILKSENGPDLDIDSIPIMRLDLDKLTTGLGGEEARKKGKGKGKTRPRERVVVERDEMLGGSGSGGPTTPGLYESENNSDSFSKARSKRLRQGLLQVDSSVIGDLRLDSADGTGGEAGGYDYERQKKEEAEMAMAVREVERLRLEMQRANERIKVAKGVPDEGTVLKKKKKVKKTEDEGTVLKKKKKKKAVIDEGDGVVGPAGDDNGEAVVVKTRKKKKKVVQLGDEEREMAQ